MVGYIECIYWAGFCGYVWRMSPMESAVKAASHAVSVYLRDLEVLSEEQLLTSAGGSARTAVDFTFETAMVNLRIAARLRNQEPPAEPEGEWWVAPEELQSKSAIIQYFKDAGEDLLGAAQAIPEEEGGKLVGAPGSERPAFALVQFASMHTMYHDAQLNFIQSLSGDLAMHWG
jgi:hypothetical protein